MMLPFHVEEKERSKRLEGILQQNGVYKHEVFSDSGILFSLEIENLWKVGEGKWSWGNLEQGVNNCISLECGAEITLWGYSDPSKLLGE